MSDLKHLRVDQIGALVSPQRLRDAAARHARGEIGDEAFTAVQDDAIRETIAREEAVGLPVVTDGEFRRRGFQESFGAAVSGFDVSAREAAEYQHATLNPRPFERSEQNFAGAGPAIYTRRPTNARLRLVNNVPLNEYVAAAKMATRPVKMTVLSPDRIFQRFAWEASKAVYPDPEGFIADVVAINRAIIASLVEAGCRYIQIDAPGYTAYVDKVSIERMTARGEDPVAMMKRLIKADNDMIKGFPGITFGIHVCKGNARTRDPATGRIVPQWHREGTYDGIAETLFGSLDHHRLLLEYDDQRSGDFSPLRFVKKDAVVVLGLVTTKGEDIEPADLLRRRIDEAAKVVPLERLALSPQCGFGGMLSRVSVPEDVQWRKFERIVDVAHTVWG